MKPSGNKWSQVQDYVDCDWIPTSKKFLWNILDWLIDLIFLGCSTGVGWLDSSVFVGEYSNKNQKWVPLRAMKTFIRKKMGHTT